MFIMRIMIVSGFFNPFHTGHLDMLEQGASRADKLVVIVNNDKQQLMKKGKIIIKQEDRMRVVQALKVADDVVMCIDDTPGQAKTLTKIATELYPSDQYDLTFGNGGDRDGKGTLPEDEYQACVDNNIAVVFDLGVEKTDSSTRINQALGHELATA